MNSPSPHASTSSKPGALRTRGSRHLVLALALTTVLGVGASGCDGLQFGDPDADRDARDATSETSKETLDSVGGPDAKVLNLPGEAEDTCAATDAGQICSFFGGEVVLRLDPGALSGPQSITLARRIFRVDERDWVGYVWGPHGLPIDPPANVTVTIPADAVPSKEVVLTQYEPGGSPTPLPGPAFTDNGDGRYVMMGTMDKFLTTLVYAF